MRFNEVSVWAADSVEVFTSSWEYDGAPQIRVSLKDGTESHPITLHMTEAAALRVARAILQEVQGSEQADQFDALAAEFGDTAVVDLGAERVRIAE